MTTTPVPAANPAGGLQKGAANSGTRLGWLRWLLRWLASGPVCVLLVVTALSVTWAFGFVHHGSPSSLTKFATSIHTFSSGNWWNIFTSLAFARKPSVFVISLVAILTIGIWSERRLGTARFVMIGLGTHLLGTIAGISSVVWIIEPATSWGHTLSGQVDSGLLAWILGAAGAAIGQLDTLWRRRYATVGFVITATLAAFSGRLSDLIRGFAFLIGVAIGHLLYRSVRRERILIGTTREGRTLVSLSIVAVIVGSALSTIRSPGIGPLATLHVLFRDVPYTWEQLEHLCANDATARQCDIGINAQYATGAAPAIAMFAWIAFFIVLALGLRKGLRAAWIGTLAIMAAIAGFGLAHVLAAHDDWKHLNSTTRAAFANVVRAPGWGILVVLVVPAIFAALLIATRRLFRQPLPRRLASRYTKAAVSLGVVALIVRVASSLIFADQMWPESNWKRVLLDAPLGLIPPSMTTFFTLPLVPLDITSANWRDWTIAILWVAIATSTMWLFTRKRTVDPQFTKVSELVRNPGGGHLSWISGWSGNQHWVIDDAAQAYRIGSGVALTAADPVCAAGDEPRVVQAFAAHCAEVGLIPAFYTVNQATATAAVALDFTCVHIGEEAVIDLPTMAFTGKAFQDVRTAINRAKRENITVTEHIWKTIPIGMREQIIAISEHWASVKGLPEMGFTLGGLDELAADDVLIFVATAADGTVQGAISLLPVFRNGVVVGRTLDFMRRRDGGFRPVIELLIATAALSLKEAGLEFLSLSSSPMVSVGGGNDDVGDARLRELLEGFAARLEPLYGFGSLVAFKSKFGPRFEPIYLAVPDVGALAAVGAAIASAHFPTVGPAAALRLGLSFARKDAGA